MNEEIVNRYKDKTISAYKIKWLFIGIQTRTYKAGLNFTWELNTPVSRTFEKDFLKTLILLNRILELGVPTIKTEEKR